MASTLASEDVVIIDETFLGVHLTVVITATSLVGVLFLLVYAQLMMVLCGGYRLVSYQTVFLYSILLWASIRLVLYSCYYFNCCEFVFYELPWFWSWSLEHFPLTLQYFTLALLVHYFAGKLLSERRKRAVATSTPQQFYKHCRCLGWILWLLSVLLHLCSNITFNFIIHQYSPLQYLVLLRVIVLDGLMIMMSVVMAICIILMFRTKEGRGRIQGTSDLTRCWSLLLAGTLVCIFLSRAIYKIIIVNLSTGHYGGTDMIDHLFGDKYGYIAYLVELLLWEVLPTYLIVFYFRVKIPCYSLECLKKGKSENVAESLVNEKYFFHNPDRYDSSDMLPSASIQVAGSRAISPSRAGYGSVPKCSSCPQPGASITITPMPGTTPPKLFLYNPSVFST